MARDGFTLAEVLVVIGVLTLIFVATSPKLMSVYGKFQLEAAKEDLIHTIRSAQNKTMTGTDDDIFSIRLAPGDGGSFTMFKGSDYALRDTEFDQVHTLSSAVNLSDTVVDDDIIFTAVSGETTDTGTITVSLINGNQSHTIDINAAGRVDIQ